MQEFTDTVNEHITVAQPVNHLPWISKLDKAFVELMPWHKEMHPDFFDENHKIKPDVQKKLLELGKQFQKKVGIPNHLLDDIQFKGSLANYNYHEGSDIDLQVMVKSVPPDPKERKKWEQIRMDFNRTSTLELHNYPIEMWWNDIRTNTASSGVYSVLKNKWIVEPSGAVPAVKKTAIKKCFDSYYSRVKMAYLKAARNSKQASQEAVRKEAARAGKQEIQKLSIERNVWLAAGPGSELISPENLALKALKKTSLVGFIMTELTKLEAVQLDFSLIKK